MQILISLLHVYLYILYSGEALPAAVMDRFSHTPLARDGEPCAGILYRQLLARLIHTRHGDLPHRSVWPDVGTERVPLTFTFIFVFYLCVSGDMV